MQYWLDEIKEANGRLLAVSPMLIENSEAIVRKHRLEYDLLSDMANKTAKRYGLVFRVAESLEPIYEKFGIDIAAANGDNSLELPIPATYVISQDGVIQYAFVDVDHTKRLDPEKIVSLLKGL